MPGMPKSTHAGVFLLGLVLAGAPSLQAEPPGGSERKNQIGLYIWAPGLDGAMTVRDETVPIDVSFDELFQDVKLGGTLNYVRVAQPWGALVNVIFVETQSEFTVPETDQGLVDPDEVRLEYSSSSSPTPIALPRTDSAQTCDDQVAWHYDDNEAPATFALCPEACSQVQSEMLVRLEVLLGCEGS